jgi:hypothetical protein
MMSHGMILDECMNSAYIAKWLHVCACMGTAQLDDTIIRAVESNKGV